VTPAERRRAFQASVRAELKGREAALAADASRLLGTLVELQASLLERLRAAHISEFDQVHLPRLLAELDRQVERWVGKAGGVIGAAVESAWERGPRLVESPLSSIGFHAGRLLLPNSLLDELKGDVGSRISRIGSAAKARIAGHVRLVVLGGNAPGDAMAAIGAELEGGGGGPLLATTRLRSETILRTEGGRAYSEAGQRRLRDASHHLPALRKKWVRGKGRPNHAIGGQVREIEQPFTLVNGTELMYPRDAGAPVGEVANCACQSVPHMASW
jgi:hypothetical protein